MKYLKLFDSFELNENSKNDPIPELNTKNKLGIILLGPPGIGKSTFVKNFITPRNQNIKTFSTDDVSLMFTKDPNVYHKGSSELNMNRLKKFMESGQSFIYDTTGTQEKNVINIHNVAKSNGYTTIFIHVIGPLDVSLKQNIGRERQVSTDYIRLAYDKQFGNISKYSEELHPNAYYIVQNKDGKYKFSKYESGKLLKRKSDKYLAESKENDDEVGFWDIADSLQEYADEGHHVVIYSANGFAFYLNSKEDDIKTFRTSINYGDLIKYRIQFRIDFTPEVNFNRMVDILDDIKSTIGRFSSMGWFLKSMSVPNNTSEDSEVKFRSVEFVLSKESKETGDEWLGFDKMGITARKIEKEFSSHGYSLDQDPEYDDDDRTILVYYVSNEMDGRYPPPRILDKELTDICTSLGASEFDCIGEGRVKLIFDY